MAEFCPLCGLNLALVGNRHRCVPRVVNLELAAVNVVPLAEVTVLDASPNIEEPSVDASPNKSRNARWRERHPDKYREGMRDYMRRKRANKSGD